MIDEETDWVPLESTDPNFGHWDHALYKDDNYANFCHHFGEVVVYIWDEWNINDFLKTVFVQLDLSQAATVESTAKIEAVSNTYKQKSYINDNKINFMHLMNIINLVELAQIHCVEEAQTLDYEMKMMDFHDDTPPQVLL